MQHDSKKILLINFGQLGDVVLSLPAMAAVARHFERSRVTALVGKATAELVRLSGLFDEVIEVDRVGLLRGPKFRSSVEILKFAAEIRRRRFDLVIDLHSLPETNLLGFFSGARLRLYANRESRSIDRLSNFRPRPPREDKSLNVTINYLRALEPLGIDPVPTRPQLKLSPHDRDRAREMLGRERSGVRTVALNPGAGHVSRRWDFSRFARLARELVREPSLQVAVFLGPEETELRGRAAAELPDQVIVPPPLSLGELAAALELADVVVGNDTGVMHLAAAMGAQIVLLVQSTAPERFFPYFGSPIAVKGETLDDISVDEVLSRVREALGLVETGRDAVSERTPRGT